MPEGPPRKSRARMYNKHEVDGIEVFLPPTLLLNGPALKIGLGGFLETALAQGGRRGHGQPRPAPIDRKPGRH